MSAPTLVPAARPWRDGLAAGVGAALVAGAVVAAIDAAGAGFATFPALLAMWAPVALVIGLLVGLAVAGFRATFGDGALGAGLGRLRRDRDLDVALTGAVLAAAVVAVLVIGLTAVAAGELVAKVERKGPGARLLGVVVVVAIPLLALLGLPIFRATRRIAAVVPRIGPAPRVIVLLAAGLLAVVGLGAFVVFTALDWQALGLGGYLLLAGLFVGTLIGVGLAAGPLRGRIPAGGGLAAAGAVAAIVLPVVVLRGAPAPAVRDAVTDRASGGTKLLRIYRGLIDRDGDGHSAFFGGPDCDDGNRAIYNGAEDVRGNGIDENCDGRDRPAADPGAAPGAVATPTPAPGPAEAPPTAAAGTPLVPDANVLIIMVDTVRADRLGAAGYQRDGKSLTPRIDQLVGESAWFTRAYSQASNTPRAMPALMAARYPSMVPVDKLFSNYPKIADDAVMLFEVLQGAGLKTYGFSSHFYFREERNFAQGFDVYDNEGWLEIAPSNKDTASPRTVPKVIARLEELARADQRFAMWVHLFEPHSTYMEHDGWPITERGTAGLMQKYDYEIAYVDGYIGQILDAVERTGLGKDTIVVLLSDHGEAFGVHRIAGKPMMFHGQTLYDELLRIPLVIKVPGAKPTRSDAVVQLIDVAPTIVEALGLPLPPSFVGRSLVPALRGEPLPPRPAYAELVPYPNWNHEARAVISGDGQWKLFDRISDNRKELYDLTADPEERRDVFAANPAKAQELEDLLLDFQDLQKAKAQP